MNRLIRSLAFAAALAVCGFATVADAAQIRMCSPFAGAQATQGRWVAANTGTAYTKNVRGCMLISPVDLGDAQAGGYIADPPVAVVYQMTAATSITIPAGTYIDSITVQETSAAAITGGLKIGTTSGATDVVAAAVCVASCLISIPDVSLLKRVFSSTTPQTLFLGAVTNFTSSPAANVTIHYSYF